ncbi:acetyl-CoA synthetase-like protein [Penicillium macrosclerotiorum]|uniref:acetyl-CoA synthetase-like protein n=1 Tax=Penicillium macrosclerotiorum TaxID=303699 RepID=UPI0025490E1A|nr:acetyl-CoA synthetase-like protein [Penicillium macrosclerotiorum]KAJ5678651.1 acetyl-CoA synthetase-like protein [Penicillium macrosclerotiorum]
MKDLARAVNFLCWWIEDIIGRAETRETLGYIGANDIRYCIFLLACQKTGHQSFLPSTRNSDEAHVHLLKATDCTKLFFSEERSTRVLDIQGLCPDVAIFQIPTVQQILSDKAGGLHPYRTNKSFADVESETTCIIHSSGTTGMPKPVYMKNGFFAAMDAIALLDWPADRQPSSFFYMTNKDPVLATTPFFHLMGLISFVFSIFHEVPIVICPDKPLSVDHLVETMQNAMKCLQELKFVSFGGAPLAPETGERLRKFTQVFPVIGASEIGWIPSFVPEDAADWGYFEWNPAYGIHMQDTGDGLFEMTIPRHKDSLNFQGIFHTFPDSNIYRTNDLYTQHPTNPNLWKFYGRQDDVIVLSNGEKFNPVTMETIIEGHPLISGVVLVGQSRFQAALLVEPSHDAPEMDSKIFLEEIWPTVQTANQSIAAHGRIMKSKIGFASKSKPFKRTPKGTVQRRAVLRDYEKEINAIYEAALEDDFTHALPKALDLASITEYTREIIVRVLEKPDISIDQDLYSAGLDSLMTIQVARALQKGLQQRQTEVRPDAVTSQKVYAHPTIRRLAQFLHKIAEGKLHEEVSREEKIRMLVEKYTADLPNQQNCWQNGPEAPSVVILTGSTGSLGTYLLHDLLKIPSVSKVYCLNRSDAENRQKKSLDEKGLLGDLENWTHKVEFLQASFGEPRFGLVHEKYQELLDSADTIIHNAWKVDFNHSVESFEDVHIQGVRRFVDFSLESRHKAHLHFVSSISTVGGWQPEMGALVPELPMEDVSVVLPQGYGESKHVSERICLEASRQSGIPTTVYRVGQIAGPTTPNGQWNSHEWLPTIITTSKAMGKIPNKLGSMVVDWVPVDTLSSIMVEIIHDRHGDKSEVPVATFHLTNSETASWSSLIPAIQSKYHVDPVEFSTWVAELESIQNPTSADVNEKPALKLLPFYRGLVEEGHAAMSVPLDVQRAKDASATMRSMGPISPQLMLNWLEQWRF